MARNLSTMKINIDPEFKNPYNESRIRHGKTRRDHANGAHARAAARKQLPSRCTSNHRSTGADTRGPAFWGG